MAAVTIRNLSDEVVEALKKRAKRNGRSMEAEIREALNRLAAGADLRSGLEGVMASDVTSRRAVPLNEVMARIAVSPRDRRRQQVVRTWAEEIDAERRAHVADDEELMDPWERAELQLKRLGKERSE